MSMKLEPGQFRVRGVRNPRSGEVRLEFGWAPDVPAEAAAWLRAQLEEPRRTILHVTNPALEPEPPFLSAWAERGFDAASIRLSIFTKAAARPGPKVLRSPRQRPGVLHARWARLPEDSTPDLVCTWHRPCTKRDSNFFHSWLLAFVENPGPRGAWCTVLDELTARGFDVKTLRFEVRHASPLHPDDLPGAKGGR